VIAAALALALLAMRGAWHQAGDRAVANGSGWP
jgi:hypothetical protein